MLRLTKDYNGVRTWRIKSDELRSRGLRSPQGFSFNFGAAHLRGDTCDNYFWTTNEFTAYLFYRRTKWADFTVRNDFEVARKKEEYLYNLSSAVDSDIVLASPRGMQYRPYQKAGIEYGIKVPNVLIADMQRLGKSIITLGIINNVSDVTKTLIVCPKTAKAIWVEECKKWLIENNKIQILSGLSGIDETANVYIINYDIIHIIKELQNIHFDVLVGDEIHIIKNNDARRSVFFTKLKATRKIGLSGTPIPNRPDELLTVIQWLDPFWKNYYVRKNLLCNNNGICLTLDEVQELLRSSIMIRRVQSQVFGGQPIQKRVIPLSVPDDLKPLVQIEINGYKNLCGLEDYTRARKLLGLSKIKYALNHIDVYARSESKLVVFCHHREVVERLAASLGNTAEVVYGSTSEKERLIARTRFKEDPICTTIIGSIPAMGMAIPLSTASHILFVESDWSGGLMQQAEERCSDQEQKQEILVEILAYEGSLDYYMANNLSLKEAISNAVLNL